MGKITYKKKRKRKISHKKKFSRRIKFIRKSNLNKMTIKSKNNKEKSANIYPSNIYELNHLPSEINYTWTLTLFNFAELYLKESLFSKKKDKRFQKKFMSIIKDLSFNENEFIYFILLIKYYSANISKNSEIDLKYETLFHIAIIAKKKFTPDFSNDKIQKINEGEFNKINKILKEKKIGIKELVRKYNCYKERVKAKNIIFYININKMVNYIVDMEDNIENTNNYVEQNLTQVMDIDKLDDEKFMEKEENNFGLNKDDSSYSEGNFKSCLKGCIFLKD